MMSRIYARIYDQPFTKHIIEPYCRFHYKDPTYLQQFKPPNNKTGYDSFQDFFIRQFNELPEVKSQSVWPCEGLLCDIGYVRDMADTNVKGDNSTVHDIFGLKRLDKGRNPFFRE